MPQSVGKITHIGSVESPTENFKKREFAIEVSQFNPETGEEYKHEEAFQFTNDKVLYLDNFNVGDKVKVSFGIRSNRSEKDGAVRYFTNLNAFRIERFIPPQPPQPSGNVNTNSNSAGNNNQPPDDLPF